MQNTCKSSIWNSGWSLKSIQRGQDCCLVSMLPFFKIAGEWQTRQKELLRIADAWHTQTRSTCTDVKNVGAKSAASSCALFAGKILGQGVLLCAADARNNKTKSAALATSFDPKNNRILSCPQKLAKAASGMTKIVAVSSLSRHLSIQRTIASCDARRSCNWNDQDCCYSESFADVRCHALPRKEISVQRKHMYAPEKTTETYKRASNGRLRTAQCVCGVRVYARVRHLIRTMHVSFQRFRDIWESTAYLRITREKSKCIRVMSGCHRIRLIRNNHQQWIRVLLSSEYINSSTNQ